VRQGKTGQHQADAPAATPVPAPAPENSPRRGAGPGEPLAVNMPAAKVSTDGNVAAASSGMRLPHERDQSAVDSTAAEPDPVVAQAAKDLAAGQVDTDLRNDGLNGPLRRKLSKLPP